MLSFDILDFYRYIMSKMNITSKKSTIKVYFHVKQTNREPSELFITVVVVNGISKHVHGPIRCA